MSTEKPGGQAAETASSVATSAVAGAATGGAAGAVVGAVKGAVATKGGRKGLLWIVAAIMVPVFLGSLLLAAMFTPSNPGATMRGQSDAYSVSMAQLAGLSTADIAAIKEATVSCGVQWQIVGAAYAAVRLAGTSTNPFAITDPMLAQQGSTVESGARLICNILAKSLQQQPGYRYGVDIGDGATVDSTGKVVWQAGSEQARQDRRDAYAAALATLPLPNASPAWGQSVYDRALQWRLGQAPAGCVNPVLVAVSSSTTSATSTASQTSAPTDLTVTSSTGQSVRVTQAMLRNVAIMVKVATDNQVPQQGMVIAAMTMAVESGWRNLASAAVPESLTFPNDGVVPGDHDSVNAFQQRAYTGYWGTPAQLMDPVYATSMFFGLNPPGAPQPHARGLLQIPGWETMAPGVAAQAVQVSAFPDRYAAWQDAAVQIIQAAAGVDVSALGGCSSSFTPGSIPTEDTYGPYWQSANGRADGVDPWNFYWGECVSYAAWMVRTTTAYTDFVNNWNHNGVTAHYGNAYQWQAAAVMSGIPVDTVPAVGSIALHVQGVTSYRVGHVAFVTGVNADGTINVSEYNFAGRHIYGTRSNIAIGPGGQFQYFLHFEQAGH